MLDPSGMSPIDTTLMDLVPKEAQAEVQQIAYAIAGSKPPSGGLKDHSIAIDGEHMLVLALSIWNARQIVKLREPAPYEGG